MRDKGGRAVKRSTSQIFVHLIILSISGFATADSFTQIAVSYATQGLDSLSREGLGCSSAGREEQVSSLHKKSVAVCLMRELGGECERFTFSCDFTPKELATAGPWWIPGFRIRHGTVESRAPRESVSVWQQQYDSISGDSRGISTSGLYPCLGISLINASCKYAVLAHVDVQDPDYLFPEMAQELRQSPNCKAEDTHVFMLLSNLVDEERPGSRRGPDSLYYRKLICNAAHLFPEANIKILLKTKHAGESNSLSIERTQTGFTLDVLNHPPTVKHHEDYDSEIPGGPAR